MIKYNKIDINHVKNAIKDIPSVFEFYGNQISAVYLFGSFSTNMVTPLSDIDLAVLYAKGLSRSTQNDLHWECWEKLAKLFKTEEIDLINLNTTPLSFRYNIIKNGKLIYYSNKDEVVDFHSETVSRYLDIKPLREEHDQAFIAGILEES